MADPMRIRAQAAGDKTTVRILMAHEMETGQRKDAAGKTIPAWFIQEVTASLNGKTVLTADWGPAVSKNPFMQFTLKGAKAGDKISVTWKDNRGDTRTDEATVSQAAAMRKIPLPCLLLLAGSLSLHAAAQKTTAEGIAEYRALLQDGNPAELFEAKGEDLWKQKRGPKGASLEKCDLGKGPAWSRARSPSCRATSPTPAACRTWSRAC